MEPSVLIGYLKEQPNYYAGVAALELEKTRKAMEPFVKAAGRVPADATDNEKVYLNGLTVGDYRRIREAYVGG